LGISPIPDRLAITGADMNDKNRRDRSVPVSATARRIESEMEIQSFLKALGSYPAQFARDPDLSFEDYFFAALRMADAPSGDHFRAAPKDPVNPRDRQSI
jgi:hypothetical protein